jgi:hypothetical protein
MKRVLLLIRRLVGLPPGAEPGMQPRTLSGIALRLSLPPEVPVSTILLRMQSEADRLYGPPLVLAVPAHDPIIRCEDRTVKAMVRIMGESSLPTERDLLSWPEYSCESLDASAAN